MKQLQDKKTTRLRYIRVLEKFIANSVALLKKDNFDFDLYHKSMLKSYTQLQKTPSVHLYSQYPTALKNLAQLILDTLENHSVHFNEEKLRILKEYNLLDKLKNDNRYKKTKHKKQSFNDGY
ncbi:MAG: hypothetical protein IE909_11510 [Campylobacterales bacterium]|nr:hypothetical protein [Campylobacterales bacterium]